MIIEHIVKGSKETTLHDFKLYINYLNVIISKGSYFRNKEEKFRIENDITIIIPNTNETIYYEIWITETGIQILSRKDNEDFDVVDKPIDRLIWFELPSNETNLSNVDIHFVKVVES